MLPLIRLWAWLVAGRVVVLLHHNGETTYSVAQMNEFGQVIAKVWWPFDIYTVVLLTDGNVRGYETSCYIKRWKQWTHST